MIDKGTVRRLNHIQCTVSYHSLPLQTRKPAITNTQHVRQCSRFLRVNNSFKYFNV